MIWWKLSHQSVECLNCNTSHKLKGTNDSLKKTESRRSLETICFIETAKTGSSREAIKVASKLGYHTVLFTERKHFLRKQAEFPEIAQILHFEKITARQIQKELFNFQQSGKVIQAILSFVDPFVSLAANLMNDYCGSSISVDALKIMEDKSSTRQQLEAHPSTPNFFIHQPTHHFLTVNPLRFPQIIKSAVSKASKDVYLVRNMTEVEKTVRKLLNQYPDQNILVEEYLEGPQYLAEVFVFQGEVKIVAVFKQHITKEKKFIITGYEFQLTMDKELYEKLRDMISSIVKELKATTLACHFEMRYVENQWKLVELNPRMAGGAMNRMIEEATGINLAKETINLYRGMNPHLIPTYKKPIYTHFITIHTCGTLKKIVGEKKAANALGIKEVFIKPRVGDIVLPAVSMGQRYGYVLATGSSSDAAKTNAMNAASKIKFFIEPI